MTQAVLFHHFGDTGTHGFPQWWRSQAPGSTAFGGLVYDRSRAQAHLRSLSNANSGHSFPI
jgi:hypothetical protein